MFLLWSSAAQCLSCYKTFITPFFALFLPPSTNTKKGAKATSAIHCPSGEANNVEQNPFLFLVHGGGFHPWSLSAGELTSGTILASQHVHLTPLHVCGVLVCSPPQHSSPWTCVVAAEVHVISLSSCIVSSVSLNYSLFSGRFWVPGETFSFFRCPFSACRSSFLVAC